MTHSIQPPPPPPARPAYHHGETDRDEEEKKEEFLEMAMATLENQNVIMAPPAYHHGETDQDEEEKKGLRISFLKLGKGAKKKSGKVWSFTIFPSDPPEWQKTILYTFFRTLLLLIAQLVSSGTYDGYMAVLCAAINGTHVVDIALPGKHIEEKFGQIAPSGILWGPVGFWNLASFLFICGAPASIFNH